MVLGCAPAISGEAERSPDTGLDRCPIPPLEAGPQMRARLAGDVESCRGIACQSPNQAQGLSQLVSGAFVPTAASQPTPTKLVGGARTPSWENSRVPSGS